MMCECFSENFKELQKKKKKELHSFQFKWLRRDELIKIKPGLKWKGKTL